MKNSILYIALSIICLLCSCDFINSNNKGQTIHLSDITYYTQNGQKVIYKDNVLFTGTAWSSDSKFMNIVVENGTIVKSNIFNPNQTVAIIVDFAPHQHINGAVVNTSYILHNGNGAPLIRFALNNQPPTNAKFVWTNVDKTSQSYGQHGYWYSNNSGYDGHEALIKKAEAVLDLELRKAD